MRTKLFIFMHHQVATFHCDMENYEKYLFLRRTMQFIKIASPYVPLCEKIDMHMCTSIQQCELKLILSMG